MDWQIADDRKKCQISTKCLDFQAGEEGGGAFVPPNSPPTSGVPLRQSERRSRELERFSVPWPREPRSRTGLTGHGGVAAASRESLKSRFAYFPTSSGEIRSGIRAQG